MTLTVHRLLHIAETIERIGPVWAWWSFPIERQCGRLKRHIVDKHHPFTNLDNYITLATQFKNVKLIYNITDKDISPDEPAKEKKGLHLDDDCMFSLHVKLMYGSDVFLYQTMGLFYMERSPKVTGRMEIIPMQFDHAWLPSST
jgi:hypothetical protein